MQKSTINRGLYHAVNIKKYKSDNNAFRKMKWKSNILRSD